jgi:alpha-1,6-mannosyltransferase
VASVDPWDNGLDASDSGVAFTLRYAVPGLVGTLVLAIGALGVGWIPTDLLGVPLLYTMQATGLGKLVAQASVILGGALILQAWLVVGGDVLAGHVRDVRRLWGVLALWIAPLLVVPPLFSRDAYSYFAQGKLMIGGVDPYSNGVASLPGWFDAGVDPMWQNTPTPYGPLFLAVSRGVAALSGNPYLAVIGFRLVAVAGVALLAYYVPRLAFHHGIDGSKALWLGVMNPLVLMHFVAGVHNDSLMVGLLVAGLCLATEHRLVTGTLLVVMGGMVKPIGLLALPFVGLIWAGSRSAWRTRLVGWLKVGALTVGAFVLLSAVVGVGIGWVRALTTPGVVKTWLSPATGAGMFTGDLLDWIGLGDHTDVAVTVYRLLAMGVAIVAVAWLILRPEGRTPVRGATLAFVAVVVLGPVVQPWYLLWALPLAAASGLKPRSLKWVMLGIAAFTLYGLWETSASADSLIELSDGIAMAAAAAAVGIAVSVSPRERALLFGGEVEHGLVPDDSPARARRDMLVVRRLESA